MSEAIRIVSEGRHDPIRAHERVRSFYNWESIAERTEKVYTAAMNTKPVDLLNRMKRRVINKYCYFYNLLNVVIQHRFLGSLCRTYTDSCIGCAVSAFPDSGMGNSARRYRLR